jgi:RNA polymerase sigma-70 factor (ECF subfamily)
MPEQLRGTTPDPSAERYASESPHRGHDWRALVESIQRGELSGMEELYRVFSRGVRFYLCRQLGPQDLDDKVHDTFLIVVQAIRKGELTEPERLMGFVRTVVRRQVAVQIDRAVQVRPERAELDTSAAVSHDCDTPREGAILRKHEEIAETLLRSLSDRDREILTRFYLMEQTQEEICDEMSLSETQFRLLKSRAKARFGGVGRKKLRPIGIIARQGESQADQVQSLGHDISHIVPIIAHAVAVFGDEHKASHWLSTPLPLFANRTPTQVLEGEGGVEAVEQILTRIEHNIPT